MGKSLIINGADFSANAIVPEFMKLAWIGSTASQTGALILKNMSSEYKYVVNFDFDKTKLTGSPSTFHIYGAIANDRCMYTTQTDYGLFGYFRDTTNIARDSGANVGSSSNVVLEISKQGIKVNDRALVPPTTALTTAFTMPYFGIDCLVGESGNISTPISADNAQPAMKIRSVKVYSGANYSTLIIDAIPVIRTEDSVVCLYNKVDGSYIEREDGTNPAYGEIVE